jgi:hypothetical protein
MTPKSAKKRSEQFLRKHAVEINPSLPLIESLDKLAPQTAEAVASRAVVLSHIICLGFGETGQRMTESLTDCGLLGSASSHERALLESDAISDQDKVNCTWLIECAQSLAYCLGITDLDPFQQADDDLASHIPFAFTDPSDFIGSAKLRPIYDIYLQADLHYRLHWAARNVRVTGGECPVQEGFIRERRKPLDWVIGVSDDWDEIPMDT